MNCLPDPLFARPLTAELNDRNGELLSAHIAADGQWRMEAQDSVSEKLKTAVIAYEDRRFQRHWGIDPRGIGRALRDNLRAGRVVSGGSTLTMQVARMARGNLARTLGAKLIEGAMATRLEATHTKEQILGFWLTNAPFGGNVVGVEAACRRYFGRSARHLSWAEAATLAVLPNSPALIHPGRNQDALLRKRNRLLHELRNTGALTETDLELALGEALPAAPVPLPRLAPHLLQRLTDEYGSRRFLSSIDRDIQELVVSTARAHHRKMARNEIHNLAVEVTEVSSGRVVAYLGNVPGLVAEHAPDVDCVTAARSPGSLLKPVLFAQALDAGNLLPRQLLTDVPTHFGNFNPANFHRRFDGAVPAHDALVRSLNVPFVYLLSEYGTDKFYSDLRALGFRRSDRGANHYGLSIILGGGEIAMDEISGWFLGLARQQRYFYDRQGKYAADDFAPPGFLLENTRPPLEKLTDRPPHFGAGAGFLTLESLRELERPDESGVASRFQSHFPVAWKTGTSFGYRDAWAVGCTPSYVVSVWVGNADGEGRDGLVGVKAAAPLLFSIFRALGTAPDAPRWFERPYDAMLEIETCQTSGLLAGSACPRVKEWGTRNAERNQLCSYHSTAFVDASEEYLLTALCPGWENRRQLTRFELPARQAYFYRLRHPEYRPPLKNHPDCRATASSQPMQLLYPHGNGNLQAAKDWEGRQMPFLFELAHERPTTKVHWHLDGDYLGTTQDFHTFSLDAAPGPHHLHLVDEDGSALKFGFNVK